jgi:acyl-CoA hydrolase
LFPVTLSATVAPTALQTKERVVVQVTTATGSADISVVHNMGLSAADLAAGRPLVNIEPLTADARVARIIVSAQSANGTTLTQLSGTNTAAVAIVTIRRPHTIGS